MHYARLSVPSEVLKSQKYSPASDVWAYGVLLWEIFTDAELPYGELSDKEVTLNVCQGARLPQPKGCPDSVYALMLECWNESLDDRIHFDGIVTKIQTIAHQMMGSRPQLPSLKS